jgi:hypothetical protein
MNTRRRLNLVKQLQFDRQLIFEHFEKHITRLEFLANKYRDEADSDYDARLVKHRQVLSLLKQLLS